MFVRSRKAVIPLWLILFGLFALFGPPLTFTTGMLLPIVGAVTLAIMLVLWTEHSPTVAEVRHHVDPSRTE